MTRLLGSLERASDRMTAANNALKSASVADLGSWDIDTAGRAFRDRWEHGISKIAETSKVVTDGLRAAQKIYQEVEQGVTVMFPVPSGGAQSSIGAQASKGAGATMSTISARLAGGSA